MSGPPVLLSREDFDALPEYSCTLPTGVTIGKRWKRREPYGAEPANAAWFLGTYIDVGEKDAAGVEWRRIKIETPRQTQVRKALA